VPEPKELGPKCRKGGRKPSRGVEPRSVVSYTLQMPHHEFFKTFGGEPHYNMGFDEWLLGRAVGNPGAVYLRLYTWSVGTITFGCNQRRETALDWSSLGDTPVIRRITGGRALYHDLSEYTYAIAVNTAQSVSPNLAGSVTSSSKAMAGALVAFLERLNVKASYVRQSSPQDTHPEFFHKAPCFASAARHELMLDGRKIVASAQKRVSGALLQHGSIKLLGVASHAALDGGRIGRARSLPAVSEQAFEATARLFCEVVGQALGVSFAAPTGRAGKTFEGLEGEVEMVKKNAWQRRLIVAQKDRTASL